MGTNQLYGEVAQVIKISDEENVKETDTSVSDLGLFEDREARQQKPMISRQKRPFRLGTQKPKELPELSFSQLSTLCWRERKMKENNEQEAVASYKYFLKNSKSPVFIDKWVLPLVGRGMLALQLERQGGPLHGAQRERGPLDWARALREPRSCHRLPRVGTVE